MSQSSHLISSELRAQALKIFKAGVLAADPYLAVKQAISIEDNLIKLALNATPDKNQFISKDWSKVHIIAFGKAAYAMTQAVLDIIPSALIANDSILVTHQENTATLSNINMLKAGHPLPDANGLLAAKKCAAIASNAKPDELILVLISGGGSALIPYPVDSITLAEKISTTDLLLASGANIHEINCVRKHLSQLKGGLMAKLAAPTDLHAIILSDVLDDDLSVIASGPTVADSTTFTDAIHILNKYELWDKAPQSVKDYLELGQNGLASETPKTMDSVFINTSHTLIGSNAISLKETVKTAGDLGFKTQIYNHQLSGEASQVAEDWVKYAKNLCDTGLNKPIALLAGGETTVTLKGKGKGGRNQEMCLAFAIAAEKQALIKDWVFLSGGTDGRDGPTDAAGGLIDNNSLTRMLALEKNPYSLLSDNNAYAALQSSDDLLITGATGTNVADLQVLLLHP